MTSAPDPEFQVPIHVSFVFSTVATKTAAPTHVELELDSMIALFVQGLPRPLEDGECFVARYGQGSFQACIERETDNLTAEQFQTHAKDVDEACLSELRKWVNLGALKIRD